MTLLGILYLHIAANIDHEESIYTDTLYGYQRGASRMIMTFDPASTTLCMTLITQLLFKYIFYSDAISYKKLKFYLIFSAIALISLDGS